MDKQQRAELIRQTSFISEADRDTRVGFVDAIVAGPARSAVTDCVHPVYAAPSPAASATKHRTLQDQIRAAKAEVAGWEPDRREAVVLQGPRDNHPPSRDCMCADCKPSFENGADDPARRYDITRGVTAASADEWMAEVIEMVKSMGGTLEEMTQDRDALYAHLLAHLKARP